MNLGNIVNMRNFRNQINFRDNELSVLILLPFNNFCSCNAPLALLWKYRTLWSEEVGGNQSQCTCGQVDLVTRTESRTLLLDELLVHIWSTASLDVEHPWKTFVKILTFLSLSLVYSCHIVRKLLWCGALRRLLHVQYFGSIFSSSRTFCLSAFSS